MNQIFLAFAVAVGALVVIDCISVEQYPVLVGVAFSVCMVAIARVFVLSINDTADHEEEFPIT